LIATLLTGASTADDFDHPPTGESPQFNIRPANAVRRVERTGLENAISIRALT
jgi:hypothetical protein